MPVSFLTVTQRESYGRFSAPPTTEELARFFHISDDDQSLITLRRGNHNKLGFAIQLGTVRFLGTFLSDPLDIPHVVLQTVAGQLKITEIENLQSYRVGEQRWEHASEIRERYGYREITDPKIGFRISRWLCALCWTGTDRPSVLFDRAKSWLLTNKVLLPGVTILERLIASVRNRMETRLWHLLVRGITTEQQERLENLLKVTPDGRNSLLDRLRSGPVRVSAPALVCALFRLEEIRNFSITFPAAMRIPQSRLTGLARYAATAKITAINRLPPMRRLATLVAFIHCLKASAHDDVLDVLDVLLGGLFKQAEKEDKRKRLRSLKDLDKAATQLADVSEIVLDTAFPDNKLREKIYAQVSREALEQALKEVRTLVRPQNNVYFRELEIHYRSVCRFLPPLLKYLQFESNQVGQPVTTALDWLRANESYSKKIQDAPRDVISKPWKYHVIREDGTLDHRAYIFCVLDELHTALRRRDIFVTSSWRYADPRSGLLAGVEWETTRPTICRTLGFSADPKPVLDSLAEELDQTYRAVIARLPNNSAVRFETVDGKIELILSPLDKLDEPDSLIALRKTVAQRLPRVDLPEILLEISARTGFADAFIHISEQAARASDITTSLCAVLLAEACNTGIEPLLRNDVPALKRDRLSWVDQNYVRNETISTANAKLVAAQSQIPLAQFWGGGDVASADGIRFVVPVRTVHAGFNPKYWGQKRGVTWYNLISDQFSGLNAITVPGTLRDSLFLLAVILEQQTELQPTQIMTDTGAYSDVIFGLFRLLGFRFCPRLADVGGTRFWRINPDADYGLLNEIARQKVGLDIIAQNWDDMLRLAGSLILGLVPATGIMLPNL